MPLVVGMVLMVIFKTYIIGLKRTIWESTKEKIWYVVRVKGPKVPKVWVNNLLQKQQKSWKIEILKL
jgi:hypothetical protein